MTKAKKISTTTTKKLKALSHPIELDILIFLKKHGPTNVKTLYSQLKLEQSICSLHLSNLRDAKLVIAKKEGRIISYSIDYEELQRAMLDVSDAYSIMQE
jgi:DNA-binding transcriptional ArsR family regulator